MRQKVVLFFFLFFFPSDSQTVARPFIDLRHPVYLITDKSFFLDCEKESALICVNDLACALADCQKRRVDEVKKGIDDWFKHFAEPTRPRAFVFASRDDVPKGEKNSPIYLRIVYGICDDRNGGKSAACYSSKDGSDPAIIYFDEPGTVYALIMAHEFGHALGYNHRDVPKTRQGLVESIMTPVPTAETVLPWDLAVVCKIHAECPPHQENW